MKEVKYYIEGQVHYTQDNEPMTKPFKTIVRETGNSERFKVTENVLRRQVERWGGVFVKVEVTHNHVVT